MKKVLSILSIVLFSTNVNVDAQMQLQLTQASYGTLRNFVEHTFPNENPDSVLKNSKVIAINPAEYSAALLDEKGTPSVYQLGVSDNQAYAYKGIAFLLSSSKPIVLAKVEQNQNYAQANVPSTNDQNAVSNNGKPLTKKQIKQAGEAQREMVKQQQLTAQTLQDAQVKMLQDSIANAQKLQKQLVKQQQKANTITIKNPSTGAQYAASGVELLKTVLAYTVGMKYNTYGSNYVTTANYVTSPGTWRP